MYKFYSNIIFKTVSDLLSFISRIENAPSLNNDKVDKGVYESVRGKLIKLVNDKPSPELTKTLPGIKLLYNA